MSIFREYKIDKNEPQIASMSIDHEIDKSINNSEAIKELQSEITNLKSKYKYLIIINTIFYTVLFFYIIKNILIN